jgi:hypothetical protein
MADVFGRQDQVLFGGLSSDSMFLTWPELTGVGGGLGLLVQNIGLDYRQPIRRIFEIGPGVIPAAGPVAAGGVLFVSAENLNCTNPPIDAACANRTQPTYYIIGRPEGQLQFGQFIGPNALTSCFYRKYGSPCNPNYMTLSGKAGCSADDAKARLVTYSVGGVTLSGINLNITAQEMVMQAGVQAMFTSLNIKVQGDNGTCTSTSTLVN